MHVVVLSASTGELVWEYTSGSFWQARGWELRMWLCEAIHCAQYFWVILLFRQLLLCDMAFNGEYAEGNSLYGSIHSWFLRGCATFLHVTGVADPT